MDQKSLEVLELPKIVEALAGFTTFAVSHELSLEIRPLSDAARIRMLLRQSAEARRLIAVRPDFSIGEVRDIREALRLARREKTLDPPTLEEIRASIAAFNQTYAILEDLSDDFPLLWGIADQIVPLPDLEGEIGRCIDPTGELLATASPRLVEIREELKHARSQLLDRLDVIMKSLWEQNLLQDFYVTERAGRYVLPVKVEFQSQVRGIIHDVSNTGATVFVEPWAIVEMGNHLRQLALEEEREIQRILNHLSTQVGAHYEELSGNLQQVAEIDVVLAKARYARAVNGNEPTILDENEAPDIPRILKLVEARHPLLRGKAVPLSIEIGRDFDGLVITGPNTGGKTVSVKTVGLLVLMAQSGLPIPASEQSRIPVFDSVFADIGDEQSIEQTLSTFSWHLGNIVRIVRLSSPRSLVLLDELGGSTDPVEGAALARAILTHFLSKRILIAATTHFGELKAFAHVTPGLENASLVFDPETLKPTYQLVMGIPGGSNAIAIAAQLGLPTEIINAAKEMLPERTGEMESLLGDLAREKQATESLRIELEKEKDRIDSLKAEAEEALQNVEDRKKEIILETKDAVNRAAAELYKEMRQASLELKKSRSNETVDQARTALSNVRHQLAGTEWQPPRADEETPSVGDIAPGDEVRIVDTGIRGKVAAILEKTGQVEVHAGRTKLKVDLQDIRKAEQAEDAVRQRSYAVDGSGRRRSIELDLRGRRADEVEPELDAYLNDVSIAGYDEVRIVHGHGTGTVRKIVRDMLASHPLVRSFRTGESEEGGDGATIVRL